MPIHFRKRGVFPANKAGQRGRRLCRWREKQAHRCDEDKDDRSGETASVYWDEMKLGRTLGSKLQKNTSFARCSGSPMSEKHSEEGNIAAQ